MQVSSYIYETDFFNIIFCWNKSNFILKVICIYATLFKGIHKKTNVKDFGLKIQMYTFCYQKIKGMF